MQPAYKYTTAKCSSVYMLGIADSIFYKLCKGLSFRFSYLITDTPSLKKEHKLTKLIVVAHVHVILALEEKEKPNRQRQ